MIQPSLGKGCLVEAFKPSPSLRQQNVHLPPYLKPETFFMSTFVSFCFQNKKEIEIVLIINRWQHACRLCGGLFLVQAKASGPEENPVLLSGGQTFRGTLLHFYAILGLTEHLFYKKDTSSPPLKPIPSTTNSAASLIDSSSSSLTTNSKTLPQITYLTQLNHTIKTTVHTKWPFLAHF